VHPSLLVAVLVYAPGNGAPRRAEVQAALEKAAGNIDLHALRHATADRTAGWVRAGELAFFQRAEEKAEEGRRLLERVELDAADAAFAEAERIYEENLGWPGVPILWSQVALWHGVTVFELGRAPLARKLFQRAVALDPKARLTEASARPDVVRAFSDAQQARPKVALSTHGEVDGASAPAEVVIGEHVVIARAPGHRPAAALIDAEAPLVVELIPAPDPVLLQLESLRRAPDGAALRVLAADRQLDAVYVAAIGVDAGALTLVGERVDANGCATAPSTVVLHGAALEVAAASLVERLRQGSAVCPAAPEAILEVPAIAHPRPPPVAVKPPTPPPRKKKFWERPWIWMGLLAVSAVSIGLAAGLATTDTTYKASVNGSAFSTR
jgi:hypothetical protein